MIAVETNILVYAHREDSPWHEAAVSRVTHLAEGRTPWAIPWPCFHEFLAIVTHPRIYAPPTPLSLALDQVQAWLESPSLILLSESEDYWARLRTALEGGRLAGAQIHDARVACLCQIHGIQELWSADRDFSRFTGESVKNPLVE